MNRILRHWRTGFLTPSDERHTVSVLTGRNSGYDEAEIILTNLTSSTLPASRCGSDWLDMVVTITNLKALGRRYPRDIAPAIDLELVQRFQDIADDGSVVVRLALGCIRISNLFWSGMSLSRTSACIEKLLEHVAVAGGLLSLAALEITVERPDGKPGMKVLKIPASEGSMHIAHASQVLKAMAEGQLTFSYEPVFNINDQDSSLYEECLSRVFLPESNCTMMPASFIPSIERAGFMNEFDRIVVSSVIDRLALDETLILGCNISAQSALISHSWEVIFDRLEGLPDVGGRLVIEITETAPVAPSRGQDFSRRLSSLGCRVAIDDFGAEYGVQNGIEIGTPDIVKLDGSFLRDVKSGRLGIERLCGLADLARELTHTVVIEGVESSEDLDIVRRAGCEWAQGYFRGGEEDIVLLGVSPLKSC